MLRNFRNFFCGSFEPPLRGMTAIVGPNGAGKTTLLEAIYYAINQRSFRVVDREALIQTGSNTAVVRALFRCDDRELLVETELCRDQRSRLQLNRQPVRTREIRTLVPMTIFSPEDLMIVQGPPAGRRLLLDNALGLVDVNGPETVEVANRIIKQRNALLRRTGGHRSTSLVRSLEVWDEEWANAGTKLAEYREQLVSMLEPVFCELYSLYSSVVPTGKGGMSSSEGRAGVSYRRSWKGRLVDALRESRDEDIRRGVTTCGPHRDDLVLYLDSREARLQASQGEHRTLALALRMALHQLVIDRDHRVPLLLLDDLFSELDETRARALKEAMPVGQAFLTTANGLPKGVGVDQVVDVRTLQLAAADL